VDFGTPRIFSEISYCRSVFFWVALVAASIGLSLCIWTVTLFMKFSKGTPAPWDPPKKLVIRGPYCYVRNPMIIAIVPILANSSVDSGLLHRQLDLFSACGREEFREKIR
jgi:protein-S-isoprenylcysteine O-methyltransferase Ste14